MATLIFTLVVDYTIQASLVGAAVAWLLVARGEERLRLPGVVALVGVFALLDLLWYPSLMALQANITIGNEAIASFLGVDGTVSADALLGGSPFDFPIWIAQAIVAMVTAQLLLRWRSAA